MPRRIFSHHSSSVVLVAAALMCACATPAHAAATEIPGTTTEISVSRWFTPALSGSANYDFGFSRPTWQAAMLGWRGDWGLRAGATIFGVTNVAGQTEPYVSSGGWLGDLQVLRRYMNNRLTVGLGSRVLGFKQVSYVTLGVGYEQPLSEWLTLQANALAGSNVSLAYVLDGSLGLRGHLGRSGLSLGFRALDLQCGCVPPESAFVLAAPFLSLDTSF